jgi:hypothetical protein
MGWKIVIGESPGTTIDASMRFNLQKRVVDDNQGSISYSETYVEVEGDVIASTPGTVASGVTTLYNLAALENPSRVRIYLDGVVKFEWLPVNCQGSPRVILFKTVDEDGSGDSHWRYAMTIYIKQGGDQSDSGGGGGGISDFSTNLTVTKEGDRVVRKVWEATANGSSISNALAAVNAVKPNGKFIKEDIRKSFQDGSVSGQWIWDARVAEDLIQIVEDPIEYIRSGADFVVETTVGNPKTPPLPVIHQAVQDAVIATVRGVVRGYDPKTMKVPAAHWTASSELIRWEAAETSYEIAVEDIVKGVYRLPYMEVWIGLNGFPDPKHDGHGTVALATAPADGKIGA